MPIHTGPCTPWEFTPDCCSVPDGTPQATIDKWRRVATSILWAMSGRIYGPACPVTVRPCKKSCMDGYFGRLNFAYPGSGGLYPYMLDGQWYNASPCGCSTDCSCGELCEIVLDGPVFDIVSVQDGETLLPPSAYRVDNGSRLVRTDGNCWDTCQDLSAAPGQPGTLTVTYRTGLPLDAAGLTAFDALVCHLIRGCSSGCGCDASTRSNLTRVQRQGVTMEMADPNVLFEQGRTGIREVDLWLSMANPYRLTSKSRVMSPDYKPQRVTTWP